MTLRIVETSDTRLVLEDAPWVLAIFLILLTLFGAFMVFYGLAIDNEIVSLATLVFAIGGPVAFAKSVRRGQLVLDKSDKRATWRVRGWNGLTEETWPLDRVDRLLVDTRRDEGETHRLMLRLKGRLPPIPLTAYHSSAGDPAGIARQANMFLGLHDALLDDKDDAEDDDV